MHKGFFKKAFLAIIITGFVTSVAGQSNWTVNSVDEPFSINYTGSNSSTLQIVEILYDDPEDNSQHPVTTNNLYDGYSIEFFYNKSEGNPRNLEYLYDGYWYADFEPNKTRGNIIQYNASGTVNHSKVNDVPSGETATLTENLDVGDIKVDVYNGLDHIYKAGKDIKVQVQAWNSSTDDFLYDNNGSVEVVFANETGEATRTELNNYNENEYYFFNDEVTLPESTNSSYVMQVNVTATSGDVPHGSHSRLIDTYPAIEGELTGFDSNGCVDNLDDPNTEYKACNPEANIDLTYEITASNANYVNLTTYVYNSTGKHEWMNMSLEENGNEYTGNLDFPDLNTSKYGKKYEFEINATNDDRRHVDRFNVTLEHFEIENRGDTTAELGDSYKLELFFRKFYEAESYDKSRFESIEVNVTDSAGDHIESFEMADLEYDQADGVMTANVDIDSSRPEGDYIIDVNASNIYGEERTFTSDFSVKDIESTFTIDSELVFEVETLWDQNFTADIKNDISEQNDLWVQENLPASTETLNESINLSANEEDFLKFHVNISELKEESGEINITDNTTGYTKSPDISIEPVECGEKDEWLCIQNSSDVNVSIDNSSKSEYRDLYLRYIGPLEDSIDVNASVMGNISDHVSFVDENKNVSVEKREIFEVNYTATSSGNFTGEIIFESNGTSVSVNTSLEANISGSSDSGGDDEEDTVNYSISVDPRSIDLGTFPSGNSASEEVALTNEGEETVDNITTDSSNFEVEVSGMEELDNNESTNIDIEFSNIDSSSGTVTIEADEEAVTDLSVSANPLDNYKDRADELRERRNSLQEQAEDADLQEDLTELSAKIDQIETKWDAQEYEEAQTLYQEVDSSLNSISSQIGSDPDPGEDPSDSGGIPVLPVAGAIIFLLLILFVIFTSYVPEEGDPLYDVLGE